MKKVIRRIHCVAVACSAAVLAAVIWQGPTGRTQGTPVIPPLPVFSPTALTADAGHGRVYLRWNLQLEDERIIGWKVHELMPAQAELTKTILTEPAMVVRQLTDGRPYTFAVTGVLSDGRETPRSNMVTVAPHNTGEAKLAALKPGETLSFGRFQGIPLVPRRPRWSFPTARN